MEAALAFGENRGTHERFLDTEYHLLETSIIAMTRINYYYSVKISAKSAR